MSYFCERKLKHLILKNNIVEKVDINRINYRYWIIATVPLLMTMAPAIAQSNTDTLPPQLISLTLGNTSIDASGGSVTQHIQARITDNLSGVNYGNAFYNFYDNGAYKTFAASFGDYNRVSGTSLDGIYDTTLTIPQYAAQGTYNLSFSTSDKASNYTTLYSLDYLGAAKSLSVTSPGDTSAPQLVSLILGNTSIDASGGSVTQHIQARITDNLSGVNYGNAFYNFYDNGTYRTFAASFGDYNRISGTSLDGIYDTTLTIPQYAAQGTYNLSFSTSDKASNYTTLYSLEYLGDAKSINIGPHPVSVPSTVSLLLLGLMFFIGRSSLVERRKLTSF